MNKTVKESIEQVLTAIGNAANFLDLCAAQLVYNLDGDDIKAFCDYYNIYPTVLTHGNWRMAFFHNRDNDRRLEHADYKRMREELPANDDTMKEITKTPHEEKPLKYAHYGWLSPLGEYYPADWCEHTEKAEELMEKFYKADSLREFGHAGDYLCDRGWVLLHNPSQGIAQVTTRGRGEYHLTKKQKEFLYDYYSERNLMEFAKYYASLL